MENFENFPAVHAHLSVIANEVFLRFQQRQIPSFQFVIVMSHRADYTDLTWKDDKIRLRIDVGRTEYTAVCEDTMKTFEHSFLMNRPFVW